MNVVVSTTTNVQPTYAERYPLTTWLLRALNAFSNEINADQGSNPDRNNPGCHIAKTQTEVRR